MEINGKKVVDAKKHLDVEVTPEDCSNGKSKSPAACAAAQAIMREHSDVIGARVHRGVTYVEYEDKWERYITPTTLKIELVMYDRAKIFEPGVHTLGAAARTSQSLKAQRQRAPSKQDNRSGGHHKNKTKRTRHQIPNIRPRGANR